MNIDNKSKWLLVLASSVALMVLPACSNDTKTESSDDAPSVEATDTAAAESSEASYAGLDFTPEFNAAGELVQPSGFRLWTFIGTPLTPNGMNSGAANFPEYHNVYTQPAAFDHYRATGKWLEGTMLVKELQLVKGGGDFEDGSRLEVSGRGYFPAAVNGMDIAVKDSSKFSDTQNWGYFNFGHHAPPYAASAPALPAEACAQCHIDNADEDMVYVDFYKSILAPLPTQ